MSDQKVDTEAKTDDCHIDDWGTTICSHRYVMQCDVHLICKPCALHFLTRQRLWASGADMTQDEVVMFE